jgi:hypothetical protein
MPHIKGKRFFFEKKAPRPGKQKTFGPAGIGNSGPQPAVSESFFASPDGAPFFSKKEVL